MNDAWVGGDVQLHALGLAIRERREGISGVSQEELAERAGLHRTYLSDIERGRRNPSYRNLVRIAAALDTPLAELVASAEEWARRRARRI